MTPDCVVTPPPIPFMRFPHVQYCGATEQEKSSESYLCWRDRLPSMFAELYLRTRHSTSDTVTELWIIHHSLLCIYWNLREQMECFAYESYRQLKRKHCASGSKIGGSHEPSVRQSHSGLIRSFTGSLSRLLSFPLLVQPDFKLIQHVATWFVFAQILDLILLISLSFYFSLNILLPHHSNLKIFFWSFQVTQQDNRTSSEPQVKSS